MARKNGFGKALMIGMAAAVAGGVVSYLRRKEIEDVVQDIADALDAREEEGFFSVDLGDEPVFHKVPMEGEEAEAPAEDAPAQDAEDSDFVDGGEAPAAEEEAPAEETAPEA